MILVHLSEKVPLEMVSLKTSKQIAKSMAINNILHNTRYIRMVRTLTLKVLITLHTMTKYDSSIFNLCIAHNVRSICPCRNADIAESKNLNSLDIVIKKLISSAYFLIRLY